MQPNAITTETLILLSFLMPKMPNLQKYIRQYSSAENKEGAKISPRLIKEARAHPNPMIVYALTTTAFIQSTLDTANHKIQELQEERNTIEKTLSSLISSDKKTPELPANSVEQLKQMMIDINQKRKDLEFIKDNLQKELGEIDKMLPEKEKIWQEHWNKYCNEFTDELKKQEMDLNEEEKNQLQNMGLNATNIQEQIAKLKTDDVNIPKKPSHFTMAALITIVATLGRNLKDLKDAPGILRKLSVIGDEKSANEKNNEELKKQHEELRNKVAKVKKQATETTGLSKDQHEQLSLIEEKVQKISSPKPGEISPDKAQKLKKSGS